MTNTQVALDALTYKSIADKYMASDWFHALPSSLKDGCCEIK